MKRAVLGMRNLLFLALIACPAWLPGAESQPPAGILSTLRREHPRLWANATEFDTLRKQVAENAELGRWFKEIRQDADEIRRQPPSEYVIPDGKLLLATSRQVKQRVQSLALVYRLTGEKAYAERLWLELDTAAHFKDWNPSHFLDTAEMTCAFALGYDWLYADWTAEQRSVLRQAIIEKGLNQALPVYRGKKGWSQARHNWNQVCNGGIGMGALVLGDEVPELAGEILRSAVDSIPLAMREFAPDGAWGEGPGYWAYATEYNVYFLAALRSALGTDFDLSKIPGFNLAASFPQSCVGPSGQSFNYADAGSHWSGAPQLFWLARTFAQPGPAAFQMRFAVEHPRPLDLLWGASWVLQSPKPDAEPLARYFRNAEVVTMRSSWEDPKATFVGFKAGDNKVNHGHLDLGTLVLDALGQRWALELGSDDYNLPGYFGRLRWNYYRLRAEGHNTLVINPGEKPDQDPRAATTISRFEPRAGASFAVADLSAAYATSGAKVRRGVSLLGQSVLVQDEIEAASSLDLWWFMHTGAKISCEAGSATLTQHGQRLTAKILSPAGVKFEVLPAEPLPSSPHPEKQGEKNGKHGGGATKKLAIHLPVTGETRICVLFTPGDANTPPPAVRPLSKWE